MLRGWVSYRRAIEVRLSPAATTWTMYGDEGPGVGVGSADPLGAAEPLGSPEAPGEPAAVVAPGLAAPGDAQGAGVAAPGAAVPPFHGVAFGSAVVPGQSVGAAAVRPGVAVALAPRLHAPATSSATSSRI